jgi:hypothetical protein
MGREMYGRFLKSGTQEIGENPIGYESPCSGS